MDSLAQQDRIRYSRQMNLPGMGEAGQLRLRAAAVLVVGAGGLGSPAAMYLAAAGVGRLGIADYDRVELHNLHRQILHDTQAIGQPKTASAARYLQQLNPHCAIELHDSGITADNALDIFSRYDLIVDGSDNFSTRYLNNDAARLSGKPLIYGSIFQFEGQVTVFHPVEGNPCYRCLFPSMPAAHEVPNCAEGGVLGALPGIIGSMQAMEAIKWITGLGNPLVRRLWVYDALEATVRTVKIKQDPDCPLCGQSPSILSIMQENYNHSCPDSQPTAQRGPTAPEIDPHEAQAMLDADDSVCLVDVREPYEWELCHLPGARLMPLAKLAEDWHRLPRDRVILCYCHHGMRSLHAVQFLRQHGISSATSLRGGIDAWSRLINPDTPRY